MTKVTKTVKKPWGCEYLLYQNDHVAIWHLMIDAYKQTSLHSHPNKKTGLVVLDGAAKVSFLGGEMKLFYGEKVMIRQGVFHQTRSMTPHPLHLFEIETPVDKEDIVRLEDEYGRAGSTKMGELGGYVHSIDLDEESTIGQCKISFCSLSLDLEFKNFMITEGGIVHTNYVVAGPGDIISRENLHKLMSKFHIRDEIKGIAIC